MIYIKLLLIMTVIVYIWDLSGFIFDLKAFIYRLIADNKSVLRTDWQLKPFTCSVCMTFWTCLIYAICAGVLSIYTLAYIALLCFLVPIVSEVLFTIQTVINRITNKINTKL